MKPVLMAVCSQASDLEAVRHELQKRYAADYEIICVQAAEAALLQLDALRAADAPLVVLLSALDTGGATDIGFLERAHELHPHAWRVQLIPWGNRSATKPMLKAMTLGQIDRFVAVPGESSTEQFHYLIVELLHQWQRRHAAPRESVTMVGERWEARSYEIRDLLERSGLPFAFHESDTEQGRALLRPRRRAGRTVPRSHPL